MKIARSGYDWFADLFCVLLLAGVFIYLAFGWKAIPEQIPGHYNAAGMIDGWTDKKELFVLPVIALIMYRDYCIRAISVFGTQVFALPNKMPVGFIER